MNLYAYVYNHPINAADPTGMFGWYPGYNQQADAVSGSMLSSVADFTPVVGDIKGIGEAIANPSAVNITAAAIGVVPGIGDAAAKAVKLSHGAESATSAVKLEKQLASEAQMSQLAEGGGAVISQPAKQAGRVAAQTGSDAGNIQKVSSDAHVAKDGQQVQTHSYRDATTNKLIEPKTIIDNEK